MGSEQEFKERLNKYGNFFIAGSIITYLIGILGVILVDQSFFVLGVIINPILLGVAVSLKTWFSWSFERVVQEPLESLVEQLKDVLSARMVVAILLGVFAVVVEMIALGFAGVGVFALLPIVGFVALIVYIMICLIGGLGVFVVTVAITHQIFNYALKPKIEEIKGKIIYTKIRGKVR